MIQNDINWTAVYQTGDRYYVCGEHYNKEITKQEYDSFIELLKIREMESQAKGRQEG